MLHHWPYFILKRRWDLQQLKEMGFNMVRKHIKIEVSGWQHFFHLLPPGGQVVLFHFHQVDRWYYWADRLGLLVWQVGKCWSKIPFNFNSEAGSARQKVLIRYSLIKNIVNSEWVWTKQECLLSGLPGHLWPANGEAARRLEGAGFEITRLNERLKEYFWGTFHGRVFALDVAAGLPPLNHHLGCFQWGVGPV